MKKSKVIIPAMALLLFSTAASITGTVAWFTSSRVFQTTVGDFTVAQLDGNLDVTMVGAAGTTAAADGKSVTVNQNVRLVDASVNFSKQAFRLNPEGNTTYKQITDANYVVQTFGTTGNETYYHAAVSWTMTINYTFASEGGDMGIYLDVKNSAFTKDETHTAGTNSGDSGKGFRIMFHDGTNGTVLGKHVAELDAAPEIAYNANSETAISSGAHVSYDGAEYTANEAINPDATTHKLGAFDPSKFTPTFKSTFDVADSPVNLKYVNSTEGVLNYKKSVETGETPSKGNYFTLDSSIDRYTDGAGNTYKANRIATIAKPASGNAATPVTVTCVAWFEGTDPNVINGTAMKTIGAKLVLYARCDAGTAA